MREITKKDKKALLKVAASVCANLSSGWFALIFIAPNFWPIEDLSDIKVLISDIIFSILLFVFAYKLERKIL